jgi:GntR family transcriptional regulator/MocR family aminotransferase
MHLVAWLPQGLSDREASRRAAAANVSAPPLSAYYDDSGAARPGLLLGYSCINTRKIQEGARRLTVAMIN